MLAITLIGLLEQPDVHQLELVEDFLDVAEPDEIDVFALEALKRFPKGGNFFRYALDFVSRDGMAALAAAAVHRLQERKGEYEACDEVLHAASLQMPDVLRTLANTLFVLQLDRPYGEWNLPWRAAGKAEIAFLGEKLRHGSPAQRYKAFTCLLETRRPDALRLALDHVDGVELKFPLEIYLHDVDHADPNTPLFREQCWHIVLPASHFSSDPDKQMRYCQHPTMRLPGESAPVRFGGEGLADCGLCGKVLDHVLDLPEHMVFDDGERTLSIDVCLSCMGWESPFLHYRYDRDGHPVPIEKGDIEPRFPLPAFLPTQGVLAPTPPRWAFQAWGASIGQNLHRIGGAPSWIQSAQYPPCPECGALMKFAMQLDSGIPLYDDMVMEWGSGGICYGFQCSHCRITAFTWQCT